LAEIQSVHWMCLAEKVNFTKTEQTIYCGKSKFTKNKANHLKDD